MLPDASRQLVMCTQPIELLNQIRHIGENRDVILPGPKPIIIPLTIPARRRDLQYGTTREQLLEQTGPGVRIAINIDLVFVQVELGPRNVRANQPSITQYLFCRGIINLADFGYSGID